jgi:hypothetical protein
MTKQFEQIAKHVVESMDRLNSDDPASTEEAIRATAKYAAACAEVHGAMITQLTKSLTEAMLLVQQMAAQVAAINRLLEKGLSDDGDWWKRE